MNQAQCPQIKYLIENFETKGDYYNYADQRKTKIQVTDSQPLLHQKSREIQEFGTLRELPIALDTSARSESCQSLNQILSDTIVLYHLYKKHHWLMRGHTFYQLHLLLDKHLRTNRTNQYYW